MAPLAFCGDQNSRLCISFAVAGGDNSPDGHRLDGSPGRILLLDPPGHLVRVASSEGSVLHLLVALAIAHRLPRSCQRRDWWMAATPRGDQATLTRRRRQIFLTTQKPSARSKTTAKTGSAIARTEKSTANPSSTVETRGC